MKERTKRINRAYRWLIWLERIEGKNDFATVLGLQRSNVTNILNGKGDASDKFCGIILTSFPGVFNRDWLLDGTGDMLATADGVPPSPLSRKTGIPCKMAERLWEWGEEKVEEMRRGNAIGRIWSQNRQNVYPDVYPRLPRSP